MLLSIRNVWFKYPRSEWILKNLSADLTAGFYCLIGCNGSGKTTLLRLIAGMLKPKRGYVVVCGKRVRSYRDVIGKIIYLPSNPSTFLVGPKIRDDFEKAGVGEDLIDFFAARKIMEKKIFEASEGERRLAAIITALAYNTNIVLLDEVTVGLDKGLRGKLVSALRSFGRKKIILLATNDFRIIPFCDEVLLLKEGRISIRGKPEDIIDEVPYLSANQTIRIYRTLIQQGADLELDKKDILKALVNLLCLT